MKKLRLLSIFLSLALVMSIFSGCFNNNDSTSSQNTAKLTWWMVGEKPKDYNDVIAEVNKYLKEKINAELDIKIAGYGDYTTKMNAIISTGENYDIAWTSNWSNPFVQQAQKGAFLELNDILKTNGKELLSFIPESLWKAVTINGKIYGVPTYKDSALMPYFVFAKEYVDKYNVDYKSMTTLESLDPFLRKIKENEPGVVPFELNANEGYHGLFDEFEMVLDSVPVGIQLDKTDSFKAVNPFETSIVKNKLKLLNKWYNDGLINKDAPTKTESSKFRVISGQHGYPEAEADWSNSFGYNVVSTLRYEPYYTTTSAQGSINAISVGSKNPTKAVELLNLINTDSKLRNLIAFGIENVHYKKTGDNNIQKLNTNYDGLPQFAQGTFFNMYVLDPAPATKWNSVKEALDKAKQSPILGFILDTKPIETEIAAATNAYNKYKGQVTTGSVNPDEALPKMMEELNKAGYQKILTEAQNQLDNFVKNIK